MEFDTQTEDYVLSVKRDPHYFVKIFLPEVDSFRELLETADHYQFPVTVNTLEARSVLLARAIWFAITRHSMSVLIYCLSHEICDAAYKVLSGLIARSPHMRECVKYESSAQRQIVLINGSAIRVVDVGSVGNKGRCVCGEHPHFMIIWKDGALDRADTEAFMPLLFPPYGEETPEAWVLTKA